MAFQAFLKLDGISGSTKDSEHKNWIDVLNFDHSVVQENTGSASAIGQRVVGKSMHDTFNIQKLVDKSTPFLNRACCSGKHIPTAIIEVVSTANSKHVTLRYTLEKVVIKSVTIAAGKGQAMSQLVENVDLEYAKIHWHHNELDTDGTPIGSTQAEHDVPSNVTA